MRSFEDPLNQERLCDLLRMGLSIPEAIKAMGRGFNVPALRHERDIDRTFDEKVYHAQASAFNPVLRLLIEQAQEDPPTPESLRAAELVVRHYNKALDREHDHAKITHVADRQQQAMQSRQGVPGITTPEQASELLAVIKATLAVAQEGEVIDAKEIAGPRDESTVPRDEEASGV